MKRLLSAVLVSAVCASAGAQEILLRHQLSGAALDALATLTLRFNDEQKGKAKVLLQDLQAVEDKHVLPTLALLDSDDSEAFFDTRPRFRPLPEVMREGGQALDSARFYPQILDAVDDANGKLQALPLALALPALLYDRAALRKAGWDPDAPPRTWWKLQEAAGALYDGGIACPLTSSRFSWLHIENVASQHGEAVSVRSGKTDRVLINNLVNVKHLALLASWQKARYFHYSGDKGNGSQRFLKRECAMLTGETSLYADARRAGIDIGISAMPYYDDVRGAKPADVLPDGAALWALAGKKRDEYKVAARYVAFLMRPDIQKEWVRHTSYLPMTPAAVEALRAEAVFPPALLDGAQKRLSVPRKNGTRSKQGPIRDRLHQFIGEEVEFVWNDGRAAKEALDNAVRRVNAELVAPAAGGK